MKINIITAHFLPELHPRAFRTFELAKSFSKNGIEVEIILLKKYIKNDDEYNYDNLGFKVSTFPLYISNISDNHKSNTKQIRNNKYYNFIKEYFLAGNFFLNSIKLSRILKNYDKEHNFIAISTPFFDIAGIALAKYLGYINNSSVIIGDSGDPFYLSEQTKRAFYFKFIEKVIYKYINYLTIPENESINAYKNLLPINKLKVIPQSIDFDSIKLNSLSSTGKIKFAFAGVFYEDIRNPEFLFKHLLSVKVDFEFHLYLRNNTDYHLRLKRFFNEHFQGKIIIHEPLERFELIRELSTYDFLVNISNANQTQIPSKIIDYALTNRPICNINKQNFDPIVFDHFMHKDYKYQLEVDLKKYDSKVVVKQFIELITNK